MSQKQTVWAMLQIRISVLCVSIDLRFFFFLFLRQSLILYIDLKPTILLHVCTGITDCVLEFHVCTGITDCDVILSFLSSFLTWVAGYCMGPLTPTSQALSNDLYILGHFDHS